MLDIHTTLVILLSKDINKISMFYSNVEDEKLNVWLIQNLVLCIKENLSYGKDLFSLYNNLCGSELAYMDGVKFWKAMFFQKREYTDIPKTILHPVTCDNCYICNLSIDDTNNIYPTIIKSDSVDFEHDLMFNLNRQVLYSFEKFYKEYFINISKGDVCYDPNVIDYLKLNDTVDIYGVNADVYNLSHIFMPYFTYKYEVERLTFLPVRVNGYAISFCQSDVLSQYIIDLKIKKTEDNHTIINITLLNSDTTQLLYKRLNRRTLYPLLVTKPDCDTVFKGQVKMVDFICHSIYNNYNYELILQS